MSNILLTLILVLSLSTVFSLSPGRYKKLTEIKSEMLLLTHRKLMVVENIYQLNNKIANVTPEGKLLISVHTSTNINTRVLEQNRQLLLDNIKKNERELEFIEKRILSLNHDIRQCIGRN